MKTMKKIVSLLLAVVLVFGMMPAAMANTGNQVYISVSYDGQYVNSALGTAIAYIPVSLDAVAGIDLDSYGLGEYWYDEDGDGVYEVTALQMVIYAHENIYGGDWNDVTFTGSPGSSYFAGGIFGFDENLNYYLNGEYPLAGEGWGATSDQIVLEAGDYLDIASFSSWDFFQDSNYGFHFFADEYGAFTHSYTAEAGDALPIKLVRSYSGMGTGAAIYDEADYTVYYGTSYGNAAGTVVTDGSGCAEIIFPSAGTWYLWCDGGYGMEYPDSIVSAPAYAEVTVNANEVTQPDEPAQFIEHTGNTLSLDGIVHINQYAAITGDFTPEFIEANGGLLIWNEEPAEADIATADVVKAGLTYDTNLQAYGQTSDGIPAKKFADELYMAIYVEYAEGQYSYGPVKAYSVQAYCESRLEKSTNEKMKALAAQMLHYGAAAQTYFRYNTDDLANANITVPADEWDAGLLDEVVAYASAPTSTGDVTIVGKNLSLEGTVLVNYYFNPATDWTVASGKLQVWMDTTELTEDNVAYEEEMTYGQVTSTTWAWGGQSRGVVAKEYGKTTYARAVLTDTEGNVHTSDIITYSPEEYAKGRINKSTDANMVNLAKHLIMYGERARLYFS